ncbi:sugar kinase [Stappia sp. ES.058]|uniref:sugar kinase n=1 Tax=Stappia sp. ES.058 TaxID=1881061 RepID=UPI00087D557B|nr:sugar kinase [Stappia sp. ES.058]SDU37929.1 2-keto-3-deoxygluconate kinase [Stappia sp. ES.058]
MADLLCFGEAMVEFNQTQANGPYVQGFGGDTSNVAVAAARQGASVGCIGATGADVFGDLLHDLWRAEGIDNRHMARCTDAPTGIYFVTHGADGHVFTYRRAGSAASLVTPRDLPRAALEQTRVLHVSAISQAISPSACDAVFEAIGIVRAAGGLVSYDTNLRLKLWPLARARAIVAQTAAMADIVLPGLDDARLLTGLDTPEEIVAHYLGAGAKHVALTLGAEGVLYADATRMERIAPHRVAAVDATGAGDAFDGAFLAEVLAGVDGLSAARHANAAAALAVCGYGAVAPLPQRGDVVAFLERGSLPTAGRS